MLDTGATAFMLVSAMLVFLMTPGVAFFYGGLARRKNVVNTMFMSFVIIGVVAIQFGSWRAGAWPTVATVPIRFSVVLISSGAWAL